MNYIETKPCAALEPYIHCFWELKGDEGDKQWQRNFPDGCPGLVANLGSTCATDNGGVTIDFAKTYMVGAMISFKDSFIESTTHLVGVCLKPGVCSNFFNYVPQNELTNKTVQLDNTHSFDFGKLITNPVYYLNDFFTNRLQCKNGVLLSVLDDIHRSKGQSSISDIARMNFVTVRWMERNFKTHIGITPKEYSNIVRFQNALSKIKSNVQGKTLFDIALDCGYYDHSHLTNEIKRHTGLSASQL